MKKNNESEFAIRKETGEIYMLNKKDQSIGCGRPDTVCKDWQEANQIQT